MDPETKRALDALRADVADLRTLQQDTRAAVQTLIDTTLQMDGTLRLILRAAQGEGEGEPNDTFRRFLEMLEAVRDGQMALPQEVQRAMLEAVQLASGDGISLDPPARPAQTGRA